MFLPNVSQEATGDAARFARDGAGYGGRNSWPKDAPRRLSSRLLGRHSMSFFIDPAISDIERGLSTWHWIDIGDKQPLRVTAFGDVFFLDSENHVWFLDRMEGNLEHAFSSIDEMNGILESEEGQESFLLAAFILRAEREGMFLNEGECYEWKVPPVLGAGVEFQNICKMNFVTALNVSGQLHKYLRDLPPDAAISKVTVDGA
jgi:hypothetical protein